MNSEATPVNRPLSPGNHFAKCLKLSLRFKFSWAATNFLALHGNILRGSQLYSKCISTENLGFPGQILTTLSTVFLAVTKVFSPAQ